MLLEVDCVFEDLIYTKYQINMDMDKIYPFSSFVRNLLNMYICMYVCMYIYA
jgi:hypothetical protein